MKQPIERYTEKRVEFGKADEKLEPGVMLVMVENDVVQAVDFLCPCGCGSECYTPILQPGQQRKKVQRPIWDYSPGPTISPSIRFTGGCKAHFNITNGEVIVHSDSGR